MGDGGRGGGFKYGLDGVDLVDSMRALGVAHFVEVCILEYFNLTSI